MKSMMTIADRIHKVREKIAAAAGKTSCRAEDIQLVAVTKGVEVRRIEEAIEAGLRIFGENRVHEARAKVDQLPLNIHWHMIGHLQRNKVKDALRIFETVQSVDSVRLAQEINRIAGRYEKTMDVLLEVNVSGETTKYGFVPHELEEKIEEIASLSQVKVRGLMTMAPFVEDPEETRPVFAGLREVSLKLASLQKDTIDMAYLSMGMSQDYEVAIEEGATMVRLGTAIFGERM